MSQYFEKNLISVNMCCCTIPTSIMKQTENKLINEEKCTIFILTNEMCDGAYTVDVGTSEHLQVRPQVVG